MKARFPKEEIARDLVEAIREGMKEVPEEEVNVDDIFEICELVMKEPEMGSDVVRLLFDMAVPMVQVTEKPQYLGMLTQAFFTGLVAGYEAGRSHAEGR